MKHLKTASLLIALFLPFAEQAQAQNPYSRSFPLSVGGIDVGELVLSFEDVIDVGDFSVTVSASAGSPSGSILPALVFPASVPGFGSPLFITIKTDTSFRGPALVSLRIYLLEYDSRIPLRLFAAQGTLRSPFRDITASVGRGSMYTSGYRDGFSEFVIGLDLRQLASVIDIKFDELSRALEASSKVIAPSRYRDLNVNLGLARDAWRRRNVGQSLAYMSKFVDSEKQGAANGEIPNSWNDPTNPAGNVGGDLFARAQTTTFSLKLAQ